MAVHAVLPALVYAVFGGLTLYAIQRISPFYTNMDDGRFLEEAQTAHLATWISDLFSMSVEAGTPRLFSWLILSPNYYLSLGKPPETLFLLNALMGLVIVGLLADALCRSVLLTQSWTALTLASLLWLWPFTAELLVWPSLQEKSVLLAFALALYWIVSSKYLSTPLLVIFGILVTGALFTSKVQVVLFIPGLMAIAFANRYPATPSSQRKALLLFPLVWALLSVVSLIYAATTPYSSGTRGTSFGLNARPVVALIITISAIISLLWVVYARKKKLSLLITWLPSVLIGPWIVAGLFWEIRNYYLSVAGVAMALSVTLFVSQQGSRLLRITLAVFFAVLATLWISYRLALMLGIFASFDEFLGSAMAEELNRRGVEIAVSCPEGAVLFSGYAKQRHLHNLAFVATGDPEGDRAVLVFGDTRVCPIEPANTEVRWSSKHPQGYRLFELVRMRTHKSPEG